MITTVYGVCLLISVGLFIYMVQKNYNTIDTHYWTIIVLIPIIILGYWLKTKVETQEAVELLFCFIYLDSTFLIMVLLFVMLHSMGIPVKSWMKIAGYGVCTVHMAIVALSVHTRLYYGTIEIIRTPLGNATKMSDGPLKVFHLIFLGLVSLWLVATIVSGVRRNGTYSRRSLIHFGAALGIGLATHLLEGIADSDFTILPLLYVIGEFIIVRDYDYSHAHDVSCVLADLKESGDARGYVTVSVNRVFLGCNEKAKLFLPFLETQRVDEKITDEDEYKLRVLRLIDAYERSQAEAKRNKNAAPARDEGAPEQTPNAPRQPGSAQEQASSDQNKRKISDRFQINGMTCACEIMPFTTQSGSRVIGYLLDLRDATEEQQNYDIIKRYNENLAIQVAEKTKNIQDIQRKIVLGMANMIENRDDNTGGHVKRTSDIIRIIVDEINRQGHIQLSEEMSQDIVRAAPTHDLGKISIDLNILTKPGRLTPEEFEIMKTHSAKSGEMVLILLDGVEEERFVRVAYNVARFHHERWDGRGYPEGLIGSMIPIEARIMAVADVYDALVSKRCYKEPMSFEQAAQIMCENMGTQFDPNMEQVFLGCREQLEAYYRQHKE